MHSTPLTDAASHDANAMSAHEHEREMVVPASVCEQIERDAMTMALRLFSEDPATFSPETREVMERWHPRVEALLQSPQ